MIDFSLTDTETAILEGVEKVLAATDGPGWTPSQAGGGTLDRGIWNRLLDLTPIEAGTATAAEGMTFLSLALIAEHLGRRLSGLGLIDHIVAVRALGASGGAGAGLATEGRVFGLLVSPPQALAGRAEYSLTAGIADFVIRLRPDQPVEVCEAGDRSITPNLGDFPMANMSGVSWRPVGNTPAAARTALAEHRVLVAAALTGITLRALELAIDYAKVREQFGAPIGSFQSIAHSLSTVQVQADAMGVIVRQAAWARDSEPELFDYRSQMAYGYAAQSAVEATKAAMHVFGGYGATWDYPIQRYFRSAKALALAAGDPRWAYRAVGGHMLAAQRQGVLGQLHLNARERV